MGELLGSSSALAGAAARHEATQAQIALAWLLHRSPVVLPIPGTGSRDHLRENVSAARIELSESDLAALGRGPRRPSWQAPSATSRASPPERVPVVCPGRHPPRG